uniref:Rna binding protein musashi n=1 Tax=Echinococcus granulosus TaxID=6210 RepID=A0A068WW85_ECHGR|nr:rna binding protein musashi [Echinococcus granulosus]
MIMVMKSDGLHNYFSKFGDIEESIVMMDNRTGRSRGFGYVKFREPSAVDQVLSKKTHVIDNKEVDPKRCNINMRGKNKRSLKIFVGGIAFEHNEETIRNFFQCFGNVTDVNLLSNPGRPRHRGFAFVGFDDEEVVKKLIKMHFVNLHGKQVEIKPMEPPNTQKTFGYVPPGMLNTPISRSGRGYSRFGSFHQHSIPYGGLNYWSHSGNGDGKADLLTDGNGGGNGWNQIINHHGNPTRSSQPPPPNQWNGSQPPSSLNGCWESQLAAAAAAAALQSNGFSSPQQQWGSQPSSGGRPSGSCFRGDGSGCSGSDAGAGSGSIEETLMNYNSWTSPTLHQQQHQGGPSHPPSNLQPTSDQFSRRIIGNVGVGGTNDDSHFANTWNTAMPNNRVNQWSRNSMPLWSSGSVVRTDRGDSPTGARLGGVMSLSSNADSSVFRMDDGMYRATPGTGVNGLTTGGGAGLGTPEGTTFLTSEAASASDWQSTVAAVAAAAQQRSMLAAAAAAAAAAASQMKR